MFAVVDIETTGGHAGQNGITEIAIFIYNGEEIVEQFETLVNPGIPIPPYIMGFTGINDEMVADAPYFSEIAEKVYELLNDKIFVAHNVNFDHTFIRHQLQEEGYDLKVKKLCTVRLGRKVFPGYRSYSLGNLCDSLGISIQNRHRAGGDAEATVELLKMILDADADGKVIASFLKKGSKEYNLPPNLPKEEFEALPTTPGVYYFHDEKGKVLYVGKAKNIMKRVTSHFGGTNLTAKRQDFLREIFHVTHSSTATELMALVLESIEIRKHWPKHNKAQKKIEFAYGLYDYEDQNGYIRLCIDRVRKLTRPVETFSNLNDAVDTLQTLVDEYNLCPKLCLITSSKVDCPSLTAGCCKGACELSEPAPAYNARVTKAIEQLQEKETYAIIDKGMQKDEVSCILIDKGRFYGMGYLQKDVPVTHPEEIKSYLTQHKENFSIRELLRSELVAHAGMIRFN